MPSRDWSATRYSAWPLPASMSLAASTSFATTKLVTNQFKPVDPIYNRSLKKPNSQTFSTKNQFLNFWLKLKKMNHFNIILRALFDFDASNSSTLICKSQSEVPPSSGAISSQWWTCIFEGLFLHRKSGKPKHQNSIDWKVWLILLHCWKKIRQKIGFLTALKFSGLQIGVNGYGKL